MNATASIKHLIVTSSVAVTPVTGVLTSGFLVTPSIAHAAPKQPGITATATAPRHTATPTTSATGKVATGIPAGIWAMESRASKPRRALPGMGTPSTGRGVRAAAIPGRWAAPPAPAMIKRSPRFRAERA